MAERGELVGDRFVLEEVSGQGGMGTVWRARDREGGVVAVKVLGKLGPGERFAREVTLLAELDHPAIVGHLADGVTSAGEAYLVMEWLDGESLADRLARGPLSIVETLALGARVAEALGSAHWCGVVHRDVKPSNLFLPGGAPSAVKLLDFGIARRRDSRTLTRTGTAIGTPGYMAPEQAQGGDVDARTDVFALGCVLFECLTGRPAFAGDHPTAILAKLLVDDVPRLADAGLAVPAALEALIERMLAKRPEERPTNGDVVAAALAAIDPEGAPPAPRPQTLTPSERRLIAVVLADGAGTRVGNTAAAGEPSPAPELSNVRLGRLENGALIATLEAHGEATDLAARAAHCALVLADGLGGPAVALAIGTGELTGRTPIGAIIDRAAQLLGAAADAGPPRRPFLDDVTAGLLDARFVVERAGEHWVLAGSADGRSPPRQLLGRPAPFVGRELELETLERLHAACALGRGAQAVLVTAPAGAGKSRLRAELVQRLPARTRTWLARARSLGMAPAFDLAAQIVVEACGLSTGLDPEMQRRALVAAAPDAITAAFVGELAGVRFPDEDLAPLRTARGAANVMVDQIRRAFVDWLGHRCREGPVLIVLEDLQWGDRPSVKLLEAALRDLEDRPLMVLALARPEVHERFPELLRHRALHEIRLGELPRRACAELVHKVLGADIGSARVALILDRSAGNAFFLEELIRAAAAGGDALPATVVAMMQARLGALAENDRRALRAASIYGSILWAGAVKALVGVAPDLAGLADREYLVRRWPSRIAGEVEYAFRHDTLREAAYAALTDRDRALGHGLAAAWLEVHDPDPLIVAGHLDRAGELARAVAWHARAAEAALRGNDLPAAIEAAERAVAGGATGRDLGRLRLLQAEALSWIDDYHRSLALAEEAMALADRGGADWYRAAAVVGAVLGRLSQIEPLRRLGRTLLEGEAAPDARTAMVHAIFRTVLALIFVGWYTDADPLLARMAALVEGGDDDLMTAYWMNARAIRAPVAGDRVGGIVFFEAAATGYRAAGEIRQGLLTRANLSHDRARLGDFARAEADLRAVLAEAERYGLNHIVANARENLAFTLIARDPIRARALALESAAEFQRLRNPRHVATSHLYASQAALEAGDVVGAEALARAAVEISADAPATRAFALGARATTLVRLGRVPEAVAAANAALDLLREFGTLEEGELVVLAAYAQALRAAGDPGAPAAATRARARLDELAVAIPDPAQRARFLETVPENLSVRALG